jgi:hypothetical protein
MPGTYKRADALRDLEHIHDTWESNKVQIHGKAHPWHTGGATCPSARPDRVMNFCDEEVLDTIGTYSPTIRIMAKAKIFDDAGIVVFAIKFHTARQIYREHHWSIPKRQLEHSAVMLGEPTGLVHDTTYYIHKRVSHDKLLEDLRSINREWDYVSNIVTGDEYWAALGPHQTDGTEPAPEKTVNFSEAEVHHALSLDLQLDVTAQVQVHADRVIYILTFGERGDTQIYREHHWDLREDRLRQTFIGYGDPCSPKYMHRYLDQGSARQEIDSGAAPSK